MRWMLLVMPLLLTAHPVDEVLDRYWAAQGIPPPALVDDARFARRAYFDLWGLPPSPQQLDAFLKDRRPDKHARLIDDLLANGRLYSDHWISFWNDHLRNDEGVIYHGDRQSITPWLRKALESNLPYDRFVQALLNPVDKADPAGFLTGVNWRGDVSASQTPVLQAAQNSAQVFLGVNLKCNSCHDSFISKWKLRDAYGLAGFFSEKPLEMFRCDTATGQIAPVKFLFPELGSVDPAASLADKRAAAARLFTARENQRTPRTLVNRFWKVLFGRGLVEPADEMDRLAWSPELLDLLAEKLVSADYDLRHLLRLMMTSRAYRSASVAGPVPKPYVFQGPLPRRLTAEQFADTLAALTGEWRVLIPRQAGPAAYARGWQFKASSLDRALGRPNRDQVVTERLVQPNTPDALELVNGAALADMITRGASRLSGAWRPAPAALFDSGVVAGANKVPFDFEASGTLWFLVEDVDSYDPHRVKAGWANLEPPVADGEIQLKGETRAPALVIPLGAVRPFSFAGRTRLKGTVGVDQASTASDINPRVRFFVFAAPPDRERLIAPAGEPQVLSPPGERRPSKLAARLYRHTLSRAPSRAESGLAREMAKSGPGLEDLLWSLLMSPEFQYVR